MCITDVNMKHPVPTCREYFTASNVHDIWVIKTRTVIWICLHQKYIKAFSGRLNIPYLHIAGTDRLREGGTMCSGDTSNSCTCFVRTRHLTSTSTFPDFSSWEFPCYKSLLWRHEFHICVWQGTVTSLVSTKCQC